MQSKPPSDQDCTIIAEEIPNVRTNALMSSVAMKTERTANETVDLTETPAGSNESPKIVHESLGPANSVNVSRPTIIARRHSLLPTPQPSSVSIKTTVNGGPSPNGALSTVHRRLTPDSQETTTDVGAPSMAEIIAAVAARKSAGNLTSLRALPAVNVHELLKATPAECFSRRGFYSCSGCSSKFTSADLYGVHLQRHLGDFSYDCEQCGKVVPGLNLCQLAMHVLSAHKGVSFEPGRASRRPVLSGVSGEEGEASGDVLGAARASMKRVVEGFLNDWNVDLFSPYQRRTKDQRYFLLPLARKEVVQSHKFYSDHFRAATNKLRDHPVELLHCFMCDFVCESHEDLIRHLQGDWPNTVTKCAFCTLSVPINKEFLCAAKAHVLLHMGVFIMCPRCGFVPPPDLSPDDFEITLRLHLRFVCFHFNLIQIFVCPHCGDSNNRAFNTANQVIMHIYDEHLAELRLCPLCRASADPAAAAAAFLPTELGAHLSSVHGRIDPDSLVKEAIVAGRRCSECSDHIPQKESFFSHMTVHHKAQIVRGKSAFRCFGTCKRIHQSIDEFQAHRAECTECVSVKNRLYQPQLQQNAPEAVSLCFCLYCGVGVRRKRLENGEVEVQSEPHMFASLRETHDHEQDHVAVETSVTACPWCPSRMNGGAAGMTAHMRGHLPGDNWFLGWYVRRTERLQQQPTDVMLCYCYATIDNPLSLHCHAIPQALSAVAVSPGPACRHLALTDALHREFLTAQRHSEASGGCPLCPEADPITGTMEMTWHIFIKHRNVLCYVCKNYKLVNGDNSPRSRVTMWAHVHKCLRLHTPRFNMKDGLDLLRAIATCGSVMANCTEFDLRRTSEITVQGPDPALTTTSGASSGGTDLADSHQSERAAGRYECGFCRETSSASALFSSRSQLHGHLRGAHGCQEGGREHLCLVCGVKFDSEDKWEDHALTEHARGFRRVGLSVLSPGAVVLDAACTSYRCYLCQHRFEKRAGCEEHMLRRHGIDHGDLNWGMLTDNSEAGGKRAKQTLNSSRTCLSTYPFRRLRRSSGSAVTEEGAFVCGVCPLQTASRADMAAHGRALHGRAAASPCPECGLAFLSARSLAVHLKLVHEVRGDPSAFLEALRLP